MDLIDYIKSNIVVFDGAMGTMLQQNGLNIGQSTDILLYKD